MTPLRTCIACRKKTDKALLARLVNEGGGLRYDRGAVMDGRGAYICPDKACLAEAYKKGAFQRAVKAKAALPDIDELWGDMMAGHETDKTTGAVDEAAPASKGGR